MAFNDFRDPIEYVVDQYFKRKKHLDNNLNIEGASLGSSTYSDESLPEYPVTLIRDDVGQVKKIIYGDTQLLEQIIAHQLEGCPIIWQEELIRDETGKTIAIDKTYPDGVLMRIQLVRTNDKITGLEIEDGEQEVEG